MSDILADKHNKKAPILPDYIFSLPGKDHGNQISADVPSDFYFLYPGLPVGQVYHTQLNPTISYLHEPGARRFSLCLDISEIFKPLIGDRLIFSLLNKRQITEDSFTKELNFLHLKQDASKLIATELEKRLRTTIMHKGLGRKVSYQYLIRLEAYKLVKHLLGEKEYEGFTIWW